MNQELSNFDFQWTKTLYQPDFLHFSKAIDAISYNTKTISHGSLSLMRKISFCEIFEAFNNSKFVFLGFHKNLFLGVIS